MIEATFIYLVHFLLFLNNTSYFWEKDLKVPDFKALVLADKS